MTHDTAPDTNHSQHRDDALGNDLKSSFTFLISSFLGGRCLGQPTQIPNSGCAHMFLNTTKDPFSSTELCGSPDWEPTVWGIKKRTNQTPSPQRVPMHTERGAVLERVPTTLQVRAFRVPPTGLGGGKTYVDPLWRPAVGALLSAGGAGLCPASFLPVAGTDGGGSLCLPRVFLSSQRPEGTCVVSERSAHLP